MSSGKQGIQPRFGPSKRTLDLAQHKRSRAVWATLPCEKLTWGTQELIRPVSFSALTAVPSSRILNLSRHKRDLSAGGPLGRLPAPQGPRGKPAVIPLRLEQLSKPKQTHPAFQSDRQELQSVGSAATETPISDRLLRLSLPRPRDGSAHRPLGPPEDAVWKVSRAAAAAAASSRVETLAAPKRLCRGYLPPREPEWRPRTAGLLPRQPDDVDLDIVRRNNTPLLADRRRNGFRVKPQALGETPSGCRAPGKITPVCSRRVPTPHRR